MGVRHVVRNIGNGSLFGHNRFFGVHNPLDYDIRKARDPFINLRTLVKLSRCPDPCVRQQVSRNLAGRLKDLDPRFLSRFDRETVIDALSLTDQLFYRPDPRSPIAKIVNEASQEELGRLVQSQSIGILSLILNNPDVSKSTKLDIVSLAIKNPSYDSLVGTAYKYLKDTLTTEELNLFVDSIIESNPPSGATASYKVLSDIVQHLETSIQMHPSITARMISTITSKTKEVVDKEPTYKLGSYEDYAAAGGDPAHGPCALPQVVDDPGESHYKYGESDLHYAKQILSKHDSNREEILSELRKINPELASAIKSI